MNVVIELLRQRFSYLIFGNAHGVSSNWLVKRNTKTFQNVIEVLNNPSLKFSFLERNITDGVSIFQNLLVSKSGKNYSANYDCESGMASFLYASILALRPKVVVETGIANGISTNVIMKALEITGGTLHSFDVDQKTANVYVGNGKWEFHLLHGNLKRTFRRKIAELGEIDYWIHDSNHGFSWQSFEYAAAMKALSAGGILVSDDIDASTAWGLMDKSSFDFSICVFDSRKFFGVAQKSINGL